MFFLMTILYLQKCTKISHPVITDGDLDCFYSFVNTNNSAMDLIYVLP